MLSLPFFMQKAMASKPDAAVEKKPTTRDFLAFFDKIKTAAVIGGGTDIKSGCWRAALLLFSHGIRVFFIGPYSHDQHGINCYPDFKSVPDQVDLAVFFSGYEGLEDNLVAAADKRVMAVWLQPDIKQLTVHVEELLLSSNLEVIRNHDIRTELLSVFSCA